MTKTQAFRPNQTSPPRPVEVELTSRQLRATLPRLNLASLFDDPRSAAYSVAFDRRGKAQERGLKSYPNRVRTSTSIRRLAA